MAEEKKDYVELKFADDPQSYRLKYDFNELVEAEKEVDRHNAAMVDRYNATRPPKTSPRAAPPRCNLLSPHVRGSMTAEEARGILYGLLRAAGYPVTLEEAGGLLNKPETQRTELLITMGRLMFGESSVQSAGADETPAGVEVPLTA